MTQYQQNEIGQLGPGNVTFGENSDAGDHFHYAAAEQAQRPDDPRPRTEATKRRQVFVIHGRDGQARAALFEFLRALGLQPLEWEQLVSATGRAAPSLEQVVYGATHYAQAVVALLTPDDVVELHPSLRLPHDSEDERAVRCQARPNVYLELGMALAINPDRTIILEAGVMRRPADLAGLNYVRVTASPNWRNKVAERLRTAGCPVDRSGGDWQWSGRFDDLAAYDRRPPWPPHASDR